MLASSKATIVHCPVSNLISGARSMNLVDLLERGAHITLGTDFLTHDIWEVMRTTYAELKQSTRSEHFGASHVWGMATKAAAPIASASGYQGTIAVGAPADLLFVEDSLALSPLIETPGFSNVAYNTLIHTRPSMIKHVMLGGDGGLYRKAGVLLSMKQHSKWIMRIFYRVCSPISSSIALIASSIELILLSSRVLWGLPWASFAYDLSKEGIRPERTAWASLSSSVQYDGASVNSTAKPTRYALSRLSASAMEAPFLWRVRMVFFPTFQS